MQCHETTQMLFLESFCIKISSLQELSIRLGRISIAVILIWIGVLKFFDYEAEGIVPFVANSPFMSFFYSQPGDYKGRILREGEVNADNRKWHAENGTYSFSYGLGILLIAMGILLLLDSFNPVFGIIGSLLVIIMSFGTLTFLITTPENWVPPLGGREHGFPYLSARGRLVVKDLIMMMAAFITLAHSGKAYLQRTQRTAKAFN